MFCCEECFSDNVLKAVIRTKGRIERCDFCGSESVCVYQLDEEEKELQNLLSSVLSLYDPSEEGSSLSAELSRHWHIINSEKLDEKTTYDLLSAMYADPKEDYAEVKAADGHVYYMACALLDTVLGRLAEEGKDAYEILERIHHRPYR